MFKAIIFDLGGVVVRNHYLEFTNAHRNLLTPQEWSDFTKAESQADIGILSPKNYFDIFDHYFGKNSLEKIDVKMRQDYDNPDQNILDLVSRLRDRFKTGLLSNNLSFWTKIARRKKFISLFDQVVFSSEVGLEKPDAKIYELMLTKLGVLPDESIFIDDSAKNIAGATKLGIIGIQYDNFNQLALDLAKYVRN